MLTEAGLSFLVEARKIVEQAERAVHIAQSVARGGTGTIRFGTTRITQNDFLPWLLKAVAGRHKGIDILPRMMRRQDILNELEAGTLDLGLLRLPFANSLLESKVILRDPLVAVLPAGHPLAQSRTIRVSALRNETFLALSTRDVGQFSRHTIEVCNSVGFDPRRIEEAESMLSLLALVAVGRGVALIPKRVAT